MPEINILYYISYINNVIIRIYVFLQLNMFLQLCTCISMNMYHLSVFSIISHRLFYENDLYVLNLYT